MILDSLVPRINNSGESVIFNLPDIYKRHYKTDLKGELPYSTYRDLVYEFNDMVMDSVIYDSAVFHMGNGLSSISIDRFPRTFNTNAMRSINWPASNTKREAIRQRGDIPYSKDKAPDGEQWFIYFMSDFVIRFRWYKWCCSAKNHPLYIFTATRGSRGNKEKLKTFLSKNPDNVYHYPLITRRMVRIEKRHSLITRKKKDNELY